MGRIDDKIAAYTQILRERYGIRYLLGTPTQSQGSADRETIAPSIPPGTYAYPNTVNIGIATVLYSDPGLTEILVGDSKNYRHLFSGLGVDAGYVIRYDNVGRVTLYEPVD
jgi:hypothetical protein